jgi:hypothetical protein
LTAAFREHDIRVQQALVVGVDEMPEADRLDVHALQFACTSGLALRPCSSCRQGLGVDENFVGYHFVDRPASCRLHLHRGPPWACLTSVGRPFKTSGVVLGRLWAQRKSRGESRKICRYGCTSDKRSCLRGYLGQRALWIRVGSRVDGSQCRGGSARCLVSRVMANSWP